MSKKIVINALCALAVISLSGCKIEMGAAIPLSGLLGDEMKSGSADLYVEVPACSSYEDSRQPSKGLISAKNEMSQNIPESEFKECFKKKFNSFALFSVPISYGPSNKVGDTTNQIRVLHNTENKFAYMELGEKLKKSLRKSSQKPSVSGGFSPSDLSLSLNLKNDTGKNLKTSVTGVYSEGYPVIFAENVSIEAGKDLQLTLSNVTTSVLLSLNHPGSAWFMSQIEP